MKTIAPKYLCPLIYCLWILSVVISHIKAAEQAGKADDFVDRMGINIHQPSLANSTTVYANTTLIQSKLADLGIRYYRTTGLDNDTDWNFYNTLYTTNGLKANILFSWDFGNLETRLQTNKAVIASVEGPNEEDSPSSTWKYRSVGFSAGTINFQNDLDNLIYYNPVLQNIPVIVPSVGTATNSSQLAGCLGSCENMHSYPANNYPSSLLDSLFIANANTVFTPPQPIIATETGYHTALNATGGGVSEKAQGKYMPRLFAEYWNRTGIVRTYSYELIDEGVDQTNAELTYGLLHNDGTAKPAFTAEKNLIALLKEPGLNFAPGSLDYSLSGSTTNVHHVLLQKSNGDFYLLLWQEVKSFTNIPVPTDIANPDVAVTLNLATPILSRAATYRYDDLGNLPKTIVTISNNTLSLSVPDTVLIVKLVTGSALTPLPPPTPTKLTATAGNSQVVLSWAISSGATGYNVKRAAVSGGPYTTIATGVTATVYTDTSSANSATYHYVASATNSNRESVNSAEVNATPAALATVIVDNADATGVTITGTWNVSTSTPDYYGPNYLHDGNTGTTGGKSVRFPPNLPTTANYQVYMRWPAELNRASNTPVDVTYAGGATTLNINQQLGCFGGTWVLLGTFGFNAGTTGNVLVRNDGANGYVMADAVKFVQVP